MKKTTVSLLVLFWASLAAAAAAPTILDSAYGTSTYYTDSAGNNVVSYDWDGSGNLYYQSATSSFTFGGFYQYNGSTTNTLAAKNDSAFSGQSVVTIGSYVYFNDSDSTNQNIYAYGPVNGTPSVSLVSTATNYGLYGHNGQLYLTGAPNFGANHIYQTGLKSDGTPASNPPLDLGADSGSSGPLAFDAAGDLFYAPGFSDLSIYKWSAAEIAAALADPSGHPLVATGHQWLNYSSSFSSFSGGTSLLVQGNQLLATLTNFSGPSELVAFGIASTGASNGSITQILESNDSLGELRDHIDNLFLSDGDSIFELNIIPEPSAAWLLGVGLILLLAARRRFSFRALATRVAFSAVPFLLTTGAVWAGPFSPAADQPGSTGVAANNPAIQGWASSVVSFNPGPTSITDPSGPKASFGTPSNALGPADATLSDPSPVVSLGDGGSITVGFAQPITNGPGADFAVFDNKFAVNGVPNSYFLELAFVAVSSDGVHFFTFPSVDLTQTNTQVASFGTLDPTNMYNLAGTEIAGYGVPFDLSDLSGVNSPFLNLNDITEVRITDVIGNINTALGAGTYSYDDATNPLFKGLYGDADHLINDPFPTNFASGGFDLDALAELSIIPEPRSAALLAAGLLVFAGWLARRRFFWG